MNYVMMKRNGKNSNKVVCRVVENPTAWDSWLCLGTTQRGVGDVCIMWMDDKAKIFKVYILGKRYDETMPHTPIHVVYDEVSEMTQEVYEKLKRSLKEYKQVKYICILREQEVGTQWDRITVNVSLDPEAFAHGTWKVVGVTDQEPRFYSLHRINKVEVFKLNFFGTEISEDKVMEKYVQVYSWQKHTEEGVMRLDSVIKREASLNSGQQILDSGWLFPQVNRIHNTTTTKPYEHTAMLSNFFKGGEKEQVEVPNELRLMRPVSISVEELWDCQTWLVYRIDDKGRLQVRAVTFKVGTDAKSNFEMMNGTGWSWQLVKDIKLKPFEGTFDKSNCYHIEWLISQKARG